MVKEWPADYKTADFEDITDGVVKAIKFAYTMKRRNKEKDIPYDGLPLTSNRLLACCLDIPEALTAEQMQYDDEDQGRSALTVLVGKAVQLGIEQGLRMAKEDHKMALIFVDYLKETLERKP